MRYTVDLRKNKNKQYGARYSKAVIVMLCVVLSVVSTIICLNDITGPKSYENMFFLPLGHCIIIAFVYFLLKGEIFNDTPVLILLITLTIRNVITPMVMVLETYDSRFGISNSTEYINTAILAFLIETAAVFGTIAVFQNRKHKKHGQKGANRLMVSPIKFKDNSFFYPILFGGVVLSVLFFILLPDLKTQYYTIFTDDITHLEHEEIVYTGTKKALQTASGMIIEAVRITLSVFLITTFRKRGENLYTWFLSTCVILLQFMFMNDSNAYVIMIALALYLLIYKLYPKYSTKTMWLLAIIVLVFGALMYANRFSKDIYGTSLSLFLQAYFPGLANFAAIESLMGRGIFDSINQIFIDLYSSVPFRSTLFGYKGGLVDLATMWNVSNRITGQILPSSAQSYYYFGLLGSPVISILLTWISLSTFEKVKNTKNPFMFAALGYMAIYAATSVAMYDFLIFTSSLTTRIAFMLLFACFSVETFERVAATDNKALGKGL